MMSLKGLNKLLIIAACFVMFSGLPACSTVDNVVGAVTGTVKKDVPKVDTPLKKWAVAQDSLTAVANVGAKLMEDKKISADVATKFVAVEKEAQSTLDDVFDAIQKNTSTKTGLTWSDGLNIALKKIGDLNTIVETFKK